MESALRIGQGRNTRIGNWYRAAAALAIAAGGFHTAHAEDLLELYTAARAYDAPYLSARALAQSAEYRAAQAEALARPNISGSVSAARVESDLPKPGLVGASSTNAAISGRHPLFNRPNQATIAQAYKSLDQSSADLETAEQDLIVRVAQAYFDVLAAQDALASQRANKAAIREQLASAKRNFEVGTATITDTREAQARFDLATAQEIAADNDLRTKRVTLDHLVGRKGVAPVPLAAASVALSSLVTGDIEQWVRGAEDAHPSIRKAQLALDIAKLETEKARAQNLPTVDVVGSVGAGYARGAAATIPGTSKTASVGLQLNVPIFSGYSIQNRVRETIVLEEKARDDLEAARRSVAEATRRAYFSEQSLAAQASALEAAEASSKLALEATQLGYRVGVRVNLDVLNA
ncbi:MAG TPA: TolC family outer membrane protein, partial [Burkholderiaceae bacterium]|nr:TolC family outer membrane protein [Burkholderiaceae bacterium]